MTTLNGSCQCGSVEYTLAREPFFAVVCHCTECQKLSSGPFSISMLVNREDFEVTGELRQYDRPATSGDVARCFFCPTCGNRIYHDAGPDAPMIRLKGTLEQKDRIRPRVQFWTRSRQAWLRGPLGGLHNLPAFATQSFERPVVIRRVALGKLAAFGRLALRVLGWVCIGLVAWHVLL
jgi:hypothetical protein